jgi:hypothetical protein
LPPKPCRPPTGSGTDSFHAEWPADFACPARSSLCRWFDRAVSLGTLACEGSGRKTDPFVYWLPHCEEEWKRDPLYELHEEQRRLSTIPIHKRTIDQLLQSVNAKYPSP